VTGNANTAVTWSASAGTISTATCSSVSDQTTCAYTAPAAVGTYQVTATSVADTSASAVATVTVTADANFVGTWLGTDTLTINGQMTNLGSSDYPIAANGTNGLTVELCNTPPPPPLAVATVTSASTFTLASDDCGIQSWLNGCNATDVSYTGGSGSLSAGGTLTMTLNGSVTGCPSSGTTSFVLTFVGCLPGVACSP
jgi:hypothetical protein